MGLFDFFRKPRKNSKHHYAFAHYALRHMAFAQPARFFAAAASESRAKFFDVILSGLDEHIEEKRNIKGADIRFVGLAIANRPCAFLEMPPTTNFAEAYFIAVVSRFSLETLAVMAEAQTGDVLIDYYTLERPVEITPDYQSVFCAWTADDSHLNFGEGPAPDLKGFILFLMKHIEGS